MKVDLRLLSLLMFLTCTSFGFGAEPKPLDARKTADDFIAESDLAKCKMQIKQWHSLAGKDQVAILNALLTRLPETTRIEAVNLRDLSVLPRQRTGELQGGDFGPITEQDVFIVGGKAGWAIESFLETTFPVGIAAKMPDDQQKLATSMLQIAVHSFERGLEAAAGGTTRPK